MSMRSLFDESKAIDRPIEKVITFGADEVDRLKREIAEYIVTDSIENQLEMLLTRMQDAMEDGYEGDTGVWVSGFYGSGKSSFTKYLGLALDDRVQIDGIPFRKHLENRLHKPQTKALLNTVAQRFPAAVILLDLAAEMVAGPAMQDVASVLYYKVLQSAGFSRNLKVAALERNMRRDNLYDRFKERVLEEVGDPWDKVQNDALIIEGILPDLAHEFYPNLFKTPTAFSVGTKDFVELDTDRVEEMLEIVKEATGKDRVLFIVDEVGQYVSSSGALILKLQGLAENLKRIGGGKAWLIGTAQQTLTEDDAHAALNSPQLYKLQARFPIQVDLESRDIKEICYKRLLAKSPAGRTQLGELFDRQGQALRQATRLEDAKYYDADLDRETFIDLYPFLPAHFDILLHMLGALAKSTGGIGLRSAIKVIQDIMIEKVADQPALVNQDTGVLTTVCTLYDSLEKDIARAFSAIHKSVGKVEIRCPDKPVHLQVAKAVAVLQILRNMPVTAQNITSLLHPKIDAPSQRDQIDAAIQELVSEPLVPFGQKDGSYCFFSEKLNGVDQERGQIPLRSIETKRIQNEALGGVFSPLPSTRLHNSLLVTSGLKTVVGQAVASLAGDRETIQMLVEFVDPKDYDTARTRLVEESRHRSAQAHIFLLGRASQEVDDKVADIYRSREIALRYRNDLDTEVKEYCIAQSDTAARLAKELQHLLKRSLSEGSFIFRGQTTAVSAIDPEVAEAAKKNLSGVADQVFDRYAEAPARADMHLAEKFLKVGNLNAVTQAIDPLSLVQVSGGTPSIQSDHKALVSIHDYIERQGATEGKRMLDFFTDAPFGWSQDTLRYLVAAMLIDSQIKLKVSGREIKVNGQHAIDALRTNNAFKGIGISLRDDRIVPAVLAKAAQRMTELVGDKVIPLEDEISKAATKQFPQFQNKFGPLAEKLDGLGLPGGDTVRSLTQELADILFTDASDAPQRLGSEESPLYDGLIWATEVDRGLKDGLETTIRSLQDHRREIEGLPDSGVPGQLRRDLVEDLDQLEQRLSQTDFYRHAADLGTVLTGIKTHTRDAAIQMAKAQKDTIKEGQEDLPRLPQWPELTKEEQAESIAKLDELAIEVTSDLGGLKQLLGNEYTIVTCLSEQKKQIEDLGRNRQVERLEEEKAKQKKAGHTKLSRSINVPGAVTSEAQLVELIRQLQELRSELAIYSEIDVTLKIES